MLNQFPTLFKDWAIDSIERGSPAKAREDCNDFIEFVMNDEEGNPLKQSEIHTDLQKFVSEHQKGVVRYPREHGKTTQMLGLISWLIGLNPNWRIKIVSSSDSLSVARGKAIKEILMQSAYQDVFPNIKPGREWTDSKFSVQRDIISPESTVECYGILSKATGGRADWLFLDDPDDAEVVVSEAKRVRNVERILNVWLNLLVPTGRAFEFCTPWHAKDISHTLIENGFPFLSRPIVDFKSIWSRWDKPTLKGKRKEIGSLAYARGFELRPMSTEDKPVQGEDFKYWKELPELEMIVLVVDPAISEKTTADYTAIGALGRDAERNIYLIRYKRARLNFPRSLQTIRHMGLQLQEDFNTTIVVGIESNAFQNALPQYMQSKKSDYPFAIKPIKATKSKWLRLCKFGVHVENGRIYLKGKNGTVHSEQEIVYDECVEFPAGAYDDCADMIALGTELLMSFKRPRVRQVNTRKKDTEKDKE